MSKWLITVTQPTRGLRQHLNAASLLKSCGNTQQVYGFILLWQSEIISNVPSPSSKENEAGPASVYFGREREARRMINNQKPEDSFVAGEVCKSFTRYRVMNKLCTLHYECYLSRNASWINYCGISILLYWHVNHVNATKRCSLPLSQWAVPLRVALGGTCASLSLHHQFYNCTNPPLTHFPAPHNAGAMVQQ